MKTRFYGDGGTIHGSTEFDVETRDGKVVAVWFRCAALPFKQTEVDAERAKEMGCMYADGAMPRIHGLQLKDDEPIIGDRSPSRIVTGTAAKVTGTLAADERVYAFCPECEWTYGGTEVESWRAGLRCMNADVPNCGGMLVFATVSSSADLLPDFEAAHV